MRKKEKEIHDRDEIEAVIQRADICRLGLCVDNQPYIVPLNFGFDGNCLYFHTGKEGKKIDMIHQNKRVCFELETGCETLRAETPCKWSMRYESVVGYGTALLVTEPEEKRKALDRIMAHYAGPHGDYRQEAFDRVAIIKVQIERMTGRRSGNP